VNWNTSRAIAVLFAVEGVWLVLRALVAVAEGRAFSSTLSAGLWSFGTLVWPGSFFVAAWFLWRQEPPTLLPAAIARALVVIVASGTNLLLISAAASGHFTFL
jgi:hypothetical protein